MQLFPLDFFFNEMFSFFFFTRKSYYRLSFLTDRYYIIFLLQYFDDIAPIFHYTNRLRIYYLPSDIFFSDFSLQFFTHYSDYFFMKDPSAKITTGINKNHFVIITKTKNENDIWIILSKNNKKTPKIIQPSQWCSHEC